VVPRGGSQIGGTKKGSTKQLPPSAIHGVGSPIGFPEGVSQKGGPIGKYPRGGPQGFHNCWSHQGGPGVPAVVTPVVPQGWSPVGLPRGYFLHWNCQSGFPRGRSG
jgi:hypothetical protein